jgi:hypothetical protein
MAEIFEIEEIPSAVSAGPSSADPQSKDKVIAGPSANDKHIPSFDFNAYPTAPSTD